MSLQKKWNWLKIPISTGQLCSTIPITAVVAGKGFFSLWILFKIIAGEEMHWSDWIHSEWDCSCFSHKVVQAKTKYLCPLLFISCFPAIFSFCPPNAYFPFPARASFQLEVTRQTWDCLSPLAWHLIGISLIPAKEFPIIFHVKAEVEHRHKSAKKLPCVVSGCAVKDDNSGGFVTVKSKQMMCSNTFIPDFHPHKSSLHPPFTKVCLSVGEERASTRSFGQILSIRSCSICRGEHKKRTQTVKPPACEKQNLCYCVWKFSLLIKHAAFLQKHRKNPTAINGASEDKASTNRAQLLAN